MACKHKCSQHITVKNGLKLGAALYVLHLFVHVVAFMISPTLGAILLALF